jgi:GntR family transcriptional regulator
MSTQSGNGVPAYQRILESIRKRIEAGDLRPGDAVASERELAKIHRVSLMTARHALATLERDHVVERRRGIGTFVTARKIHFNRLMSFTEQMTSRSLKASSKILSAKIVGNEPEAAARLSLPPLSKVFRLERLRFVSNEPTALETCYFDADQFGELVSAPLQRESLFAYLERKFGVELRYSDDEVDATAADPRIAKLLGVPKREPVLRFRQTIHSTTGKVILYVLGIYRSDRHNLIVRRFR